MATEDLTTYTEVDEGSDITVTTTKADVSSMTEDMLSYVVKSYGSGHFTTFNIDFEHAVGAVSSTNVGAYYVGVSNESAPTRTSLNANGGIFTYAYRSTGAFFAYLRDTTSDGYDVSTSNITTSLYYSTLERTGSSTKWYIYTDETRETLFDTLSVTYDGTAYEYLHAVMSADYDGDSDLASWYTQNIDLNEATSNDIDINHPSTSDHIKII